MREAARELSPQAIEVLRGAMEDDDPRVRIKAAEVLLDRAWGKPPQAIGQDAEAEPFRHIFQWKTE